MKVKKEIKAGENKEEEGKVTSLMHIMWALSMARGIVHYRYNCNHTPPASPSVTGCPSLNNIYGRTSYPG
jgi:hypothetical protein